MSNQLRSPSRVLRATYRFQFNEHFRLRDATLLVPYLRDLGISHIYASPLFAARPHSSHGYDVCDFSRLNPALGTEEDLKQWVSALHECEMGMVLDIVPNHMGIGGPENAWWWDVLEKGQGSRFANYFDIDWNPSDPRLRGKVLVPVLGDHYARILERGELKLESAAGVCRLRYFDWQFPVAAESGIAEETLDDDPGALDKVIQQQHYLPAAATRGDEDLNYRRFFAVSTLAAVRVEEELVFGDVHQLVRRWLDAGYLDGLRVDHPDGLRDPGQYLQRLRKLAPKSWIIVEKILQPDESIPSSWPIAGTTGYDFLNIVNGLFVDSSAEVDFTNYYVQFAGEAADYAGLIRQKRKFVLHDLLATEVKRLTGILVGICSRYWRYRDFARNELSEAIVELAACFPVYRTYIRADDQSAEDVDASCLSCGIDVALRSKADLPVELFDLLRDLLSLKLRGSQEAEFVARFQQLTGAAMAKGVEDTAFYCFNRFVSLNEVGGDPARFGVSIEEFHAFCRDHQQHWPESMLSTSTHDTKRSEEVRARLNVLSEMPGQWIEAVHRWSAMNTRHRSGDFPDHNIEYLFYQTMVGAWPLPLERLQSFMEKAACEAAQYTSWKRRNDAYHEALKKFVAGALNDAEFIADLAEFIKPVRESGYVNSLAQTLLKLTAPGVPDIYQGSELWDLSLVDPDNRRPVDFDLRQRLFAETKEMSADQAWRRREAGVAKLWLIRKTLGLRRRRPEPFAGSYQAVTVRGQKSQHVVALMRGEGVIAVVSRLTFRLEDWSGTVLELPSGSWRDELSGGTITGTQIPVASLFSQFPVALLCREKNFV